MASEECLIGRTFLFSMTDPKHSNKELWITSWSNFLCVFQQLSHILSKLSPFLFSKSLTLLQSWCSSGMGLGLYYGGIMYAASPQHNTPSTVEGVLKCCLGCIPLLSLSKRKQYLIVQREFSFSLIWPKDASSMHNFSPGCSKHTSVCFESVSSAEVEFFLVCSLGVHSCAMLQGLFSLILQFPTWLIYSC